jgi:hypothetical protein
VFKRLFGKKTAAEGQVLDDSLTAEQQKGVVFDQALEDARMKDPLVPLRIGAQELVQMLIAGMKSERGVHVESLLAAVGSLAGFCCVDSTLKQVARTSKTPQEFGIIDVEMSDGRHYFLGDPINALLGGTDRSLWALVAGMANQLGTQDYPDFGDIAKHVAGSLGGDQFGLPRVPDNHRPGDLPINYVRNIWPAILPHLEKRAPDLRERVMLLGLATQEVMQMGKDVIDPALAAKLVMECAVPMAKLNPADLWPQA